jgi:glycerol-3-phosphate cytidylyltransferase
MPELPTVYTGGTFDLFHSGHAAFLHAASRLGRVTVALNDDEFVERFKGKRPIMSLDERFSIISSCRYVSCVVVNTGGEDSKPAILSVRPDIIVIGTDWLGRDYYKQLGVTQEFLDINDITLVYVPYTQGISTTLLKERLVDSA